MGKSKQILVLLLLVSSHAFANPCQETCGHTFDQAMDACEDNTEVEYEIAHCQATAKQNDHLCRKRCAAKEEEERFEEIKPSADDLPRVKEPILENPFPDED